MIRFKTKQNKNNNNNEKQAHETSLDMLCDHSKKLSGYHLDEERDVNTLLMITLLNEDVNVEFTSE